MSPFSYRACRRATRRTLFACFLTVAIGAGCGSPDDLSTDFSTYTGSAVEVPYEADAAVVDFGGQDGPGGTGGGTTAGGSAGTAGDTGANAGGATSGAGMSGGDAGPGVTTGGSGDPGNSGGSAGAPRTLSFSVLTKAVGGKYQPRNVGAIWVETASGSFVKTLAVWAATRERYLTKFVAAGRNRVDAVTSATLRSHTTHSVQWDSTDVAGAVVADGEYRLVVEITDRNSSGDFVLVPFTKGAPFDLAPSDVAHFVNMRLRYQ